VLVTSTGIIWLAEKPRATLDQREPVDKSFIGASESLTPAYCLYSCLGNVVLLTVSCLP